MNIVDLAATAADATTEVRTDLAEAIESKNVTVDASAEISNMAEYVARITAGGEVSYYTRTEIDETVIPNALKPYYTKTEIDVTVIPNALAGYAKVDALKDYALAGTFESYYTKTEIDETVIPNALKDYALASTFEDYYTKTEIDETVIPNALKPYATEQEIVDDLIPAALDGVEVSNTVPVGTIFETTAATPPRGAYVLNGQLIENCEQKHPSFWAWLIEQKNNASVREGDSGAMNILEKYYFGVKRDIPSEGYQPPAAGWGSRLIATLSEGALDRFSTSPGIWEEINYRLFWMDARLRGAYKYASDETWYSPVPLIVRSLTLPLNSNANATVNLEGSIDGDTWEVLASASDSSDSSASTLILNVPADLQHGTSAGDVSASGWHYLRLSTIPGEYSPPPSSGYFRQLEWDMSEAIAVGTPFLTEEQYQRRVKQYGFCSAFVLNTATKSVRLPTWSGYLTNSKHRIPVAGEEGGAVWFVPAGGDTLEGGPLSYRYSDNTTLVVSVIASCSDDKFSPYDQNALGTNVEAVNYRVESFAAFPEPTGSNASTFSVSPLPYFSGLSVKPEYLPKADFLRCIQVYGSVVNEGELDAAALITELQTKVDLDLGNAVPGEVFKTKMRQLAIPDYTQGVEYLRPLVSGTYSTEEQTFTAPADGVVVVCLTGYNGNIASLHINDECMASVTGGAAFEDNINGQYYVAKGDVVRFKSGRGKTSTYQHYQRVVFYPFKG